MTAPARRRLRIPFLAAFLVFTTVANADESIMQIAGFTQTHCIGCHEGPDAERGFEVSQFTKLDDKSRLSEANYRALELIIKRVRARQMPPPESEKPSESEYASAISAMEHAADDWATRNPRPGRTSTLRRLTRVEYGNAIRDLLALNVDVTELLPKDESSHGFDNITVTDLSPALLSRYLTAAETISRKAVGTMQGGPSGIVVRVPQDRTQDDHVEGLPLGTRGGVLVPHHFSQDGQYEIRIKLARDRDEKVEGLFETHQLDVLLDRRRVNRFEVRAPGKGDGWQVDHTNADVHLRGRFDVLAGPHNVGVTFPRKSASLNEIKREPFDASFNRHRHPRRTPAVYEVSITGPFDAKGPGDTPSRRRLFGENFTASQADRGTAEEIISRLLRRAYRRPVNSDDLATPMAFFESGSSNSGFELGIQSALSAILVNPNFLFRIESDPAETAPSPSIYPVDDITLASRLSFFLWSSIPDDELLQLAERGQLSERNELRRQVSRMLADDRSESLITNFAAQWLYLRNLASITPDLRAFPDFDDNLRHAMRRETELAFANVIRHDRSVLDLLSSNQTFLNERLAKHYEIPGVRGSAFRRVAVNEDSHRGGILRHASILTATSYATRTSPTIRGNWILENVLGTPAPPPPPNVPALKEKPPLEAVSVRERLKVHRENPACASCHNLMDPIGFALENYDALGRWREYEGEFSVDSSAVLPDGQQVSGIDDLETALLKHPELFVSAMVEKLMTFALGRGMEVTDGPAVRSIVNSARENDYRFSSIIAAIVESQPFLMREAQ